MSILRTLLSSTILLVLAGCVSKPVEAEVHAPPLMIAQNSDGEVTIAWDSEPGRVYTIYYQSEPDGDWMVLHAARRMPGTGQTLTIHDSVNPKMPMRRYRMLPEDL